MSWRTIRLELARSPGFPKGSASRAYLLHLPVDANGRVDEDAFRRAPALATVRRHWPNERDRTGHVIRRTSGWAFSYAMADRENEELLHFDMHKLRAGEDVTITEPDGTRLPYRVMQCEAKLAA
jgi:hypothetical protein